MAPILRSLLWAPVLLISACSALAATWTVTPDGTGDFPTIQDAVDVSSDGDVVELADGTYTGDGNRDINFLGKAITVRSQSGVPELCVISCEGTEIDRHRGFVFESGEGPGSRVEHVTITGGWAQGGGILCTDGSSPTIVGCIIAECRTPSSGHGGGLLCRNGASPTLINCTIRDCQSRWGGAVGCDYNCSPSFRGCSFVANAATSHGGAVWAIESSTPTFSDCNFVGNTASSGGAIKASDNYNPGPARTSVALYDCVFSDNSATYGGAIHISKAGLTAHDCIVIDNRASRGGAVWLHESESTIERCVFARNWAQWGPAIEAIRTNAEIFGCTFYGNVAERETGTIRSIDSSDLTIYSSILVSNLGASGVSCESSTATLHCSDVYDNEEGDWVGCIAGQLGENGNFSADPLLCDPVFGDFSLRSDSPCLPGNHPDGEDCGLIGTLGEGCSGPTPTVSTSWGQIKQGHFREH